VITVDLQGHGRTADVDRPLSFQTMGDDIAALIRHLGLPSRVQADVMGYSFGAGTALRTAIQHPDLVRRLVIVSHPVRHDGWFPQSLAGFDQMGPAFAEAMKQSPIYEAYARVAPRVEDWPVLVDKMGTLLRQDYDWSAEVAKITAPVMLVYGDADSVWPAHIAEFYALLGGGLRTRTGTARPGPWRGWPSCPATRTTTSSSPPACLTRSSRSWKLPRWTRPRRWASKAVSVRAGRTAVRSTAEAGRTRAGGRTRATRRSPRSHRGRTTRIFRPSAGACGDGVRRPLRRAAGGVRTS
jgi:Predicted hydrolases or acyltransferases (alpha/beta hydrolase superfamily)